MTIQKRQWIWLAVTLFIYILALFLVRTFVHYTWRPETWISAIVGGVIVFYTYWTWRMAKVAAADLEMRTRPVVTAEITSAFSRPQDSPDQTPEHSGMTFLHLEIRIVNHAATHGYAKVLVEWVGIDIDLDSHSGKVESGDFDGKTLWALSAKDEIVGGVSLLLDSRQLEDLQHERSEWNSEIGFYLRVLVESSVQPDFSDAVKNPEKAYELLREIGEERSGLLTPVQIPASKVPKPAP